MGPLGADVGRSAVSEATLTTGPDGDADGDRRCAFRFEGTAVALTVRRGPYRAFLYVTVDGRPANRLPWDKVGRTYVVLYDNEPAVATIPLATGLSRLAHRRGCG